LQAQLAHWNLHHLSLISSTLGRAFAMFSLTSTWHLLGQNQTDSISRAAGVKIIDQHCSYNEK
jgi:hypothetical protein